MSASIHYIVKSKLIRFIKEGEINFIEINEKFENDNPIEAREKAFDFYQNNIDVLLQGKDKKYLSHEQAEEDLNPFVDSGIMVKWNELAEGFEFPNSYGNGIGVYMVVDKPIEDYVFDDKIGEEFLIHGISYNRNDPQAFMDSLTHEYLYYNQFNYDTKNYAIKVNFYEADANEVNEEIILKTPFDWTGYDKLYNSIDEGITSVDQTISVNSFKECIELGEGNQIEFKSSLVSFKKDENVGYSKHVIFKIVKAIASFLNSNGGILFIGVKDDKSILGLDSDFSLTQSESETPKDYFKKQVDYIIKNNFKPFATYIKGDFIEIEGKIIYAFIVEPSSTPVFVFNNTDRDDKNHKKEFYVRLTGASSIHYYDIEEIVSYCLNHWKK